MTSFPQFNDLIGLIHPAPNTSMLWMGNKHDLFSSV